MDKAVPIEVHSERTFTVRRKGTTVIFSCDGKSCSVTAINTPVARKITESFEFWSWQIEPATTLEEVVRLAMWETAWLRTKTDVPHDYLRDSFRERLIRDPAQGYERASEQAFFYAEAALRQATRRHHGQRKRKGSY